MKQWPTSPWTVASIILLMVGIASWFDIGLPFFLFVLVSLFYGAAYISRKRGLRGKLLTFALLAFSISMFFSMNMNLVPGQFFFHLFTGWVSFFSDVVFQAQMNWSDIGFFFVLLTVFSVALHSFCAWLYASLNEPGATWQWSWTGAITGLIFLLFMTTMSTVGIAHQMAWFSRYPSSENSWQKASIQIRDLSCAEINSSSVEPTSTSAQDLRVLQQNLNSLDRRSLRQLRLLVVTEAKQGLAGVLVLPKDAADRQPKAHIAFCPAAHFAEPLVYDYAQLDDLLEAAKGGRLEDIKPAN